MFEMYSVTPGADKVPCQVQQCAMDLWRQRCEASRRINGWMRFAQYSWMMGRGLLVGKRFQRSGARGQDRIRRDQ